MFLLGILSIIQITILPGLLALSAFPFRKSIFQGIAYTYIISFFLNYLLACVLTFFHVFLPVTLYLIVISEILLIFYFQKRNSANSEVYSVILTKPTARFPALIWGVCLVCGILGTFIFLGYACKNLGTIFSYADEIGSYNYWAVQWTKNRMPSAFDTMGYPVAISANWAIGYLLIKDSTVQFFNKFATAFFPFVAALSFWGLAIKKRSLAPLLGSLLFFLLLKAYTPLFIGSGPLDVVIACIAICVLVSAFDYAEDPENLNKLVTLQLLAASAASLKQSGLILAGATAIFSVWVIWKKIKPNSKRLNYSLLVILLFLALSLTWYLRIQFMIYQGLATSESSYLIRGIHGGSSYSERFIKAIQLLILGKPIFSIITIKFTIVLTFLLLSFFSWKTRFLRNLIFLLGIPYFFLWAFLFSYEPRTLAPIFPIFALATAYGLLEIVQFFFPNSATLDAQLVSEQRRRVYLVFGILGLMIPIGAVVQLAFFSKEVILAKQLELQKQVIDSELNQKLYQYNDVAPFTGKVASIYGTLKFLPNLSHLYFHLRAPATLELIKYLEEREDIHFLLISVDPEMITYSFPLTDSEALDHIDKRIREQKYSVKFRHRNLALIKIR